MLFAAIDQDAVNVPQHRVFTAINHPDAPPRPVSGSLSGPLLLAALSRSIYALGLYRARRISFLAHFSL
jgi:hypothetical protein